MAASASYSKLPIFLALFQHVGVALAFQAQPGLLRLPIAERVRCSPSHKLRSHDNSSPKCGGRVRLSASEGDSSSDELLEKFAMPLEFKKGAINTDAGGGNDDVSSDSDVSSSSANVNAESKGSSAESLSISDKTTPSDQSSAPASAGFAPSPDTPLANKYYLKKMQIDEASKQAETQSGSQSGATKAGVEAPTSESSAQAPRPRRRFTDFGIASEQSEPIKGEKFTDDPGTDASDDSVAATKLRGFTDWSITRKPRSVKVGIEKAGNSGANYPETKPPGDAAKPAAKEVTSSDSPTTTTGESGQNSVPSIRKEEPTSAAPATTAKEKNADPKKEEARVEEEKATPNVSADKSTAATSTVTRDETDTSSSASQPLELIQTQPASAPNAPTLPSLKLDAEDFGLIPLAIIGLGVSLSLGVYLKQSNDTDKDDKQGTEKDGPSGALEKFTEESKNLLQKVKDAGTAGAISYALWEAAFWGVSIPVCLVSYRQVTGHWPDLTSSEDVKKIGLEAFAFVNFARLAVPIRIGLALSTVPWVEKNILSKFSGAKDQSAEASIPLEQVGMASTEEYIPDSGLQPTMSGPEMELLNSMQPELSPAYDVGEGVLETDTFGSLEQRLDTMETEALRISSASLETINSAINSGIDPTLLQKKDVPTRRYVPGNSYLSNIDDYCEPGQVTEGCSESIQGYLDSLASSGAVATNGEVKAIVGYLDSLSSNISPNEERGNAFVSYLDALSTGYIPAPASAEAVAGYLNELSIDDSTAEVESRIGSRMNEVEERLSRLETSVNNLPDDIASKLSVEMEKITKLLVDNK
ncbi:hypothetical protein ACHAWF_018566 [Thalassiosira exigua]